MNLLSSLYLLILIAVHASPTVSQSCGSWEGHILVCQPNSESRGFLRLEAGVFTFNRTFEAFSVEHILWNIDGLIIESALTHQATLKDILYLKWADISRGTCPEVQLAHFTEWCAGNPFCSPDALTWTASTDGLVFIATTNLFSLKSLSVWNASTFAWLETLIVDESSLFTCDGAATNYPLASGSPSVLSTSCSPNVASPSLEPQQVPSTPGTDSGVPQPSLSPLNSPSATPPIQSAPSISSAPSEVPTSGPSLSPSLDPAIPEPQSRTPLLPPSPSMMPPTAPNIPPQGSTPMSSPNGNGTISPTIFNVPGSRYQPSSSSRVGLIVGLSVGIPLLAAVLIAAGALTWMIIHRSNRTEEGPLAPGHLNPLYVGREVQHINPLYRPTED